MTKANIKTLCDIYSAVSGLCSETGSEEFDHFYRGGGEKMFRDFEKILTSLGVVMREPQYTVTEYYDRTSKANRWAIISDPNDPKSYVLTGMSSKEEAEQVLKDVVLKD